MEATARVPLSERINLRMVVFGIVVLALLGTPIYIYVETALTLGIVKQGNAFAVDLKSLGNFPFDGTNGTVNDVPDIYRKLDGQRVILEGEMYAGNSASEEVNNFQLVYSIAKCCFGGPPKVQERVFVRVPNGGTVKYYYGKARVVGKLHIQIIKEEGKISTVYILDAESAEQA